MARYKLAAAGYLLQPGTPFIYYGEEIGQAGVPGLQGDLPLRSPMSWSADAPGGGFTTGTPFRPLAPNLTTNNVQAQRAEPQSIWHFYKAMLALRNGFPSIARGSYEGAFAQGLVAGWQRRHGREHTVVLLNYGTDATGAAPAGLPAGSRLAALYPADGGAVPVDDAGNARIWLPPQAIRVYRVER